MKDAGGPLGRPAFRILRPRSRRSGARNAEVSQPPKRDFYEIQSRQRKTSLALFLLLLLFYCAAVGLIGLAAAFTVGLFAAPAWTRSGTFWTQFLIFDVIASMIIAFFHFKDARDNGAAYIIKRLQGQPPDASDRYHRQFVNVLEEIQISAGRPKVNPCVISSFAVNSMALIEPGNRATIAVTEGLLADCTRDELQAVVAHEMAHIARGDSFYLTLVCSLANVFEKLRESLEPEEREQRAFAVGRRNQGAAASAPLFFAATLCSLAVRLLSTLVSREREILADAAAVELIREPLSLARAVYKAHIKNSFIGDFCPIYTPLFIVPPDSRDISDGFWARVFNSHPPLMRRLSILAGMADKSPSDIVSDVWRIQRDRGHARGVLRSFEEMRRLGRNGAGRSEAEMESSLLADSPARTTAGADSAAGAAYEAPGADKVWMMRNAQEIWDGPYSTEELLGLPGFSTLAQVKNVREDLVGKGREFPQIRTALRRLGRKKTTAPRGDGRCPRCRIPMADAFNEGVPVKTCTRCRGTIIAVSAMDRIIARREVTFSNDLIRKAEAFRERFVANPLKKHGAADAAPGDLKCPACGYRMVSRPYSYQYFVPVDKCLSCLKIWFDADELEILQILIENRPTAGA